MSESTLMQAAQLVVEGRVDDGAALASAVHEQSLSAPPVDDATAVTQRLTAGLIGVIASAEQRDPDALDHALAFVEEARLAGRPAWMAAGRAVAARVMLRTRLSADVLTILALAELDLEEELDAGRAFDPPNGPTGPGAAANNLGAVYLDLGLMDRAEHHLVASAKASMEEYGPSYRGQVGIDLVNLLAFRLAYAIEKEIEEDAPGAAEQARSGLVISGQITALAPELDWPPLVRWARILELGCLSVVGPLSMASSARHEVDSILEAAPEGGLLHSSMSYVVLARLCRQAGDASGAAGAADRALHLDPSAEGPEAAWAWREAALAVDSASSPALLYAGTLRGRLRRQRVDLAAALEHRIALARLERMHAEVRAAREQLERALDEAGEHEVLLQEAASHDPLTGLLNRAALQARLARTLATADDSASAVAVAFLDLDGFKQVNDRRGHVVGDQFLAAVASGLRSAVRDADVLARYGGDEFVCVREGVREPDDLLQWAERLRRAVEDVAVSIDEEIPVTASIGLCVVSDRVDLTPTEVIARADAAMYEAKRKGPGRIRLVTVP